MSDLTLKEKLAVAARCDNTMAGEALKRIEELERDRATMAKTITRLDAALAEAIKHLKTALAYQDGGGYDDIIDDLIKARAGE